MKRDITIFCLTYNHVNYIRDALNGFLKQNTNYTYNVFVFDDASTDGTSEILREYGKKYPQTFDIYISPKNIYTSPERPMILRKLYDKYIIGKYVAWCEGDDYWIDDNKLQEQIDFLESHPSCVMVAHGCKKIDFIQQGCSEYRPYQGNQFLTPEQVIIQKAGNLPTASLVMRKEVFLQDKKFPICDVGDIPMQLYALDKGEIYYIDKVMSVYRSMHVGSWSQEYHNNAIISWKHRLGMADFLKKYDEYTEHKFHEYVQTKVREYLYIYFMGNEHMGIEKLVKTAAQVNEITDYKYRKYLEAQVELFRMKNEVFYLSSQVRKYIGDKKYIIVMGTGEYSDMMSKKLIHADIHIDGYVISDNQMVLQNCTEKPVWKLKDYPYLWEETGLIIGISEKFQLEIEKNLAKKHICEYCAPYWLDIK